MWGGGGCGSGYCKAQAHFKQSGTDYVEVEIVENLCKIATVLPAKSDSDIMFCLQSYQGLRINRSLVYRVLTVLKSTLI